MHQDTSRAFFRTHALGGQVEVEQIIVRAQVLFQHLLHLRTEVMHSLTSGPAADKGGAGQQQS